MEEGDAAHEQEVGSWCWSAVQAPSRMSDEVVLAVHCPATSPVCIGILEGEDEGKDEGDSGCNVVQPTPIVCLAWYWT